MPTEIEIKEEILTELKNKNITQEIINDIIKEIDIFASKEGVDGKSILQKFYSQWKSNMKGDENKHNSKLAYYLGLTILKPNEEFNYKLRRAFARPSPPDVDSDFDYFYRDPVIEYIVKKYGRERVANIGTYNGLKMKSALTRIMKALDIADAFDDGQSEYVTQNNIKVREIIDSLPKQYGAILTVKDDNGEEHKIKSTSDAVKHCKDFSEYMKRFPDVVKHASNIEGLLSVYGVHASGVGISDVPFSEIAPLRTAKEKGDKISLSTQYTNEDLEALGIIKFDVLAISTLTVISECVKMIKNNYGINLDVENLPLDDNKTFELYRSGKLTGVFQCESPGMQKTCIEMGVDSFEDISALISLYRPGPMDTISDYCARKRGDQPISYFHPSIEKYVKPYLKETYGLLCYQEQVMQICNSLGGMTISQGYDVIKGIGKKKEDIVKKFRLQFIDGAVLKGIPKEVVEQYWDRFISPFASYGFNKSHSLAYAYNSYITAYLKANFPEEFMVSYLNVECERRKLERVADLEAECRRMGMEILSRDINKSKMKYEIVRKVDHANGISKSQIMPSIHCKNLSYSAAESIVKNAPYKNLLDFAEKVDLSVVDSESIVALSEAGFFKTKKEELVKQFNIMKEDLKRLRKNGLDLFDMMDEIA